MLKRKQNLWKGVYVAVVCCFCGQLLWKWQDDAKKREWNISEVAAQKIMDVTIEQGTPVLAFMKEVKIPDWSGKFWEQLSPGIMSVHATAKSSDWMQSKFIYEEEKTLAEVENKVIWEELQGEEAEIEEVQEQEETEIWIPTQEKQQEEPVEDFSPQVEKIVRYTDEQLHDTAFVQETFFTTDRTTRIEQSQLEKLNDYDASIEKRTDGKPQILIYHTHSQETYADSDVQDAATTVVGVGERLAELLHDKYGYEVLHHRGEYDKETRDYAYSYAAKGLDAVLAQNPTIEVIIDLHRDAVKEETRLVTQIQGKEMAKFMFFNGMCYTNAVGKLETLPNPYLQENLSFAFQLKLAAEEYYPGLTRKNYLKGYRYNMQYRAKSLLIEVGAQNNTVEEAMNACEPLAHILSMVLEGKNRQ